MTQEAAGDGLGSRSPSSMAADPKLPQVSSSCGSYAERWSDLAVADDYWTLEKTVPPESPCQPLLRPQP